MLGVIAILCIMILVASGVCLWMGYRWGKQDERHEWRRLINIGELPEPGQAWVPATPVAPAAAAAPPPPEPEAASAVAGVQGTGSLAAMMSRGR